MRILFDFNNVVNRPWGVPLATIDDLKAFSSIGNLELSLYMSTKEFETAKLNLNRNELKLKNNIDFTLNLTRASNRKLWLSQFFETREIPNIDYFFAYHFPAVKIKHAKRIVRIHDPFLKSKKLNREFFTIDSYKNKSARIIRSIAFEKIKMESILVCISRVTAEQLELRTDINSERLHIIPNSFNCKSIQQIELLKNTDKLKDDYFLVIGGLRGNKRPNIIINAWSEHFNDLPKLLVIGSVPLSMLNKKALNALNKGRLIFREQVSQNELNALCANANAMIFASLHEGFGRPIIEALIHGVPSLANDLPIFREINPGGVEFFSLNDPNSLVLLLKKYQHKISFEQSKNLIRRAQVYSHTNIGKQWKDLLDKYRDIKVL